MSSEPPEIEFDRELAMRVGLAALREMVRYRRSPETASASQNTKTEVGAPSGTPSTASITQSSAPSMGSQPMSSVQPSPTLTFASARIGQIGEKHVQEILEKKYGPVSNVTKTARSGDLSMEFRGTKLMAEVKNYKTAVGRDEIEKFWRDLGTTNSLAGLFISLKTPITGITDDFTLRFENIGTKTVPCAYLVSSDEAMIRTASSMVLSLESMWRYATHEIASQDRVISGVKAIGDGLDGISRSRMALQGSISEIVDKLVKISDNISTNENLARRAVDSIRPEITTVAQPDSGTAFSELVAAGTIARYPAEIQNLIGECMKLAGARYSNDGVMAPWKISARKCVLVEKDLSLEFPAKYYPRILLPRSLIPPTTMYEAICQYPSQVEIGVVFAITIEPITIPLIKKILCAEVEGAAAAT